MTGSLIHSFPPVENIHARILILGSMPGALSLSKSQYYAHPRNLFWPIMGELIGAGREHPYLQRLQLLKDNHVALWDVLQSCERVGSLDSNIKCEVMNDFETFFAGHSDITHVFFNGGKAESSFRRHVKNVPAGIAMTQLPSTSPMHTSLSFEKKLAAWSQIKI